MQKQGINPRLPLAMIKKILFLLVLSAIGCFVLFYFFGSGLISKAVETIGPKVTQTSVRLEKVALHPLSSSGTLQGLYIGNPDGYKNEHIFSLNQIDVAIDLPSLLTDRITVRKIHIRNPEMSYEKTLSSSNLKSLQANVESFGHSIAGERPPKDSAQPETEKNNAKDSSSKRILIEELLIENMKVQVGLMGADTSVTIPKIELQNLDSGSTAEAAAKILQTVLSEVTRQLGAGVSKVGNSALSELEAIGKEALGNSGENGSEVPGKELLDNVINLFSR